MLEKSYKMKGTYSKGGQASNKEHNLTKHNQTDLLTNYTGSL